MKQSGNSFAVHANSAQTLIVAPILMVQTVPTHIKTTPVNTRAGLVKSLQAMTGTRMAEFPTPT